MATECRETPKDPESDCNASKPGCNRGQEYEYDGENRLVRIRKDTNNAQGLPDGQGGQTPIAEQNVQMEFVYDALGWRVEAVEYVSTYHGEAHISLSLGAARVVGRCPDGFGSAKNALTGGWLHA